MFLFLFPNSTGNCKQLLLSYSIMRHAKRGTLQLGAHHQTQKTAKGNRDGSTTLQTRVSTYIQTILAIIQIAEVITKIILHQLTIHPILSRETCTDYTNKQVLEVKDKEDQTLFYLNPP